MSRHSSSGSHSHAIHPLSLVNGEFRLSWVVDRYFAGSRQRWPRETTRDTDASGAKRFAKRWGLTWPDEWNGAPE